MRKQTPDVPPENVHSLPARNVRCGLISVPAISLRLSPPLTLTHPSSVSGSGVGVPDPLSTLVEPLRLDDPGDISRYAPVGAGRRGRPGRTRRRGRGRCRRCGRYRGRCGRCGRHWHWCGGCRCGRVIVACGVGYATREGETRGRRGHAR